MNFLDLGRYTGTQLTVDTFSITVSPEFETFPQGLEVVVLIRDSAGTYAVVTGTLSGSTFTAIQLLGSRSGTIPNFSGTVTITSTYGAELINRGFGKGGFLVAGQSNPIGQDSGFDRLIDFVDGSITQFRFDARDNTGTLYAPDGEFLSEDPLFWAEQTTVADTVSPVPHMAKALKTYGGHSHIQILPGAKGSTAFGPITSGVGIPGEQWPQGGVLYERLKDMAITFLNKDPNNYLAVMLLMLGESDSLEGMTEAEFSVHTDDFWENFKADIFTATGYDMSFTPLVVVGMNDTFIAFEANAINVENSMADVGNRITRSSYISIAGLSSVDNFHTSTEGLRTLGTELFVPVGYFPALANWTLFGTGLSGAINATATVTGKLLVPLIGSITATATVTGNLGEPGAALAGGVTATATLTGNVTSPTLLDAEFLAGTGITKNGSNQVSQWASTIGGHTMDQNGADSLKPIDASGTELAFDGSNDRMQMSAGMLAILNSTTACTMIFQYTTTTSGQVMTGGTHSFISIQAATTNFRIQDTTGNDDFLGSDTNDGVMHYCSMSVDRVGGIKQIIIDGVVEDTDISIETQASDSDVWWVGCGNSLGLPLFFCDVDIHNIGVKEAALNLTQVEAVVAGW